jgi:pSer/pThr/pTyr-binding forkhead associated (FHA) protein
MAYSLARASIEHLANEVVITESGSHRVTTSHRQPPQNIISMASIRIPFPENDQPSSITLQGARVTVGRLPFNTLQIIDRTISGFHAELILEDGHYRLHDRDSTNGTFINGEPATDFHLREACKISFGTVECDFDPAAEHVEGQGESVPTRGEINTVRQENAELRGTLAAVREEVTALLAAKPGDETEQTSSREEFTKIVAEREALKEARLRHEQEIARLKTDLAVVRRDRENLQRAWDATKAELAKVQRPIEAVAVVEASTAVRAQPAETVVPVAPVKLPSAPAVPMGAPLAPVAPTTPLSRPSMPTAKPVTPLAPPTGRPFPAPKPAVAVSTLVPAATVVAKAPLANSSGVRPFPKAAPTVALTGTKAPPPTDALPKPVAGILHPRTSVMPVHAPAAGPKGTQKLR